ncbi:MAG: hypothetical protein ACOX81_04060 [Candidatus Heteroscillospira sp.]
MDEFAIPADFQKIWARVTDREPEQQLPSTPVGELERFINGEVRAIDFYQLLAARCTGRERRTLMHIITDERRHLRLLQLEYFMRTGDSFLPPATVPAARAGVLQTIREAVLTETEAAAAYTAAGKARGGDLGTMYMSFAGDETEHAAMLREMLGRCFTAQG